MRPIKSVTTDVKVYDNPVNYIISIPIAAWRALDLPEAKDREGPIQIYLVVRDLFGNLIAQKSVEVMSGYEIDKRFFKQEWENRQLYPGQFIRLEISRA